ncbi:MAG: tripartite tricarboxylate transporter permease [Nanoarchaeota archaeon]|nr:tripartite tricarboxylate transporter permease [Nanoarchaeota archaeon]
MIEYIIAIIIGMFLGIITGLTPGVHINLVATLLLALTGYVSGFGEVVAFAILAMSIMHVFLDALPSIFLGAPDATMAMAVLPGHQLLQEGRGVEAIFWSNFGGWWCIFCGVVFAPLTIWGLMVLFPLIKEYIGYIIFVVVLFGFFRESSKVYACIIFMCAGILGIVVFSWSKIDDPLFPLFSGLFGLSALIQSLMMKVQIPKQNGIVPSNKKRMWLLVPLATIISSLCSFLPGLGGAQATALASSVMKEKSPERFLVVNGGINAVNMLTSVISWFAIGKARNGAIVVMSELMELTVTKLFGVLGVVLVVASIGFWLSLVFARWFSRWLEKVNYERVCWCIIIFVVTLLGLLTGLPGLLVAGISTLFGLLPEEFGVAKQQLMGCLLIPILGYYFL